MNLLVKKQGVEAKLEELLHWCDQLEAYRAAASHLLDATIQKILTA